MADSASAPGLAGAVSLSEHAPRHTATVRITHWLAAACVFALLLSGVEILISHPRFYWGETGNVLSKPLFTLPIPASRASVPTGYNFVLKDQNGWSRSLHFQAAWFLFFTALLYGGVSLVRGHFRRNLLPAPADVAPAALFHALATHWRKSRLSEAFSYNPIQRLAYSLVVFLLTPLMFWTGLAMSPGFVAAYPLTVTSLGGQQSARTIHFFVTLLLVLFVVVHVVMVGRAGFLARMRAMVTGRVKESGNS